MLRTKVLCHLCNREISKSNITKHIVKCSAPKMKSPPRFNPRNTGNPGKNQFTKARELGLHVPQVSPETRAKLSACNTGRVHTDETKQKISEMMKQVVLNNPDSYTASNVCGRVKIREYRGQKFHGQWEVDVAKWLDANNIVWERKVAPVKYIWNSKWHLYFPDFYLPELDVFVEVKGYETDKDRCKWKEVKNLIVLKQAEVFSMRKNEFKLVLPTGFEPMSLEL